MKRLSRMLGVTLLEIMLVLAIAAMVIVMSIRYYQTATSSQQTNAVIEQVLAITAAADNLSQGAGTYSAATLANIENIVGSVNMRTPWSAGAVPFVISGAGAALTISVSQLPNAVCTALAAKINTGAGSHFTAVTPNCGQGGNGNSVVINYNMVPK